MEKDENCETVERKFLMEGDKSFFSFAQRKKRQIWDRRKKNFGRCRLRKKLSKNTKNWVHCQKLFQSGEFYSLARSLDQQAAFQTTGIILSWAFYSSFQEVTVFAPKPFTYFFHFLPYKSDANTNFYAACVMDSLENGFIIFTVLHLRIEEKYQIKTGSRCILSNHLNLAPLRLGSQFFF